LVLWANKMQLPTSLRQICLQSLEAVKNDPNRYLDNSWRGKIYQDIKLSPQASKIAGWIDVLTARKVVPIWEEFERTVLSKSEEEWLSSGEINIEEEMAYYESLAEEDREIMQDDPATMLQAAEDFLHDEMTEDKLSSLLSGSFYDGMMGLFNYATWTSYNAKYAAYWTVNGLVGSKPLGPHGLEEALIAYAGIDKNAGGVWNWSTPIWSGGFLVFLKDEEIRKDLLESEKVIMGSTPEPVFWLEKPDHRQELVKQIRNYIPIGADLDRALEFWEWWLTEAIPQAWELAQQ